VYRHDLVPTLHDCGSKGWGNTRDSLMHSKERMYHTYVIQAFTLKEAWSSLLNYPMSTSMKPRDHIMPVRLVGGLCVNPN
jgi:hypothetical protein